MNISVEEKQVTRSEQEFVWSIIMTRMGYLSILDQNKNKVENANFEEGIRLDPQSMKDPIP